MWRCKIEFCSATPKLKYIGEVKLVSFASGTVSVGTTATAIVTPTSGIVLRNNGPRSAYLGDASVTTDGWVLEPGDVIEVPPYPAPVGFAPANDLYGITASGTALVSWFRRL